LLYPSIIHVFLKKQRYGLVPSIRLVGRQP